MQMVLLDKHLESSCFISSRDPLSGLTVTLTDSAASERVSFSFLFSKLDQAPQTSLPPNLHSIKHQRRLTLQCIYGALFAYGWVADCLLNVFYQHSFYSLITLFHKCLSFEKTKQTKTPTHKTIKKIPKPQQQKS